MELVEVKTKDDLRRFVDLPWKIYKNYSHWVPPLKKDVEELLSKGKNPFFEHSDAAYFIVKNGNETLGRIAAIENRNHNNYHKDRVGFFGFFECVDDPETAKTLFDKAKNWCASRRLDTLRGPTSFSTNDECGLLIEGFDKDPTLMMPYNPPYYMGFFEKYGFNKSRDLLAFSRDLEEPSARVKKLLGRITKKNIHLRSLDLSRFNEELQVIKDIYNSSWSNNWGFVPMTDGDINYMANGLKPLVDPSLVFFAETNNETVAFSLSLPDYNQVLKRLDGKMGVIQMLKFPFLKNKINLLRLMAMGVKQGFRNRGIELLLCYETLKRGKEIGLSGGELGWVLENNSPLISVIDEMGGFLYKKYRIYDLSLVCYSKQG